ncbi:MAG: hypothetical protein EU550_02980 [Promethearchaeota archaeon]|nr:MAG: hypothetical protein EU550_02980 [Candidatus Lokiarchaeota archaeon]
MILKIIPKEIYEKVKEKKIDINHGINLFFKLVEDSNDFKTRKESLELLNVLNLKSLKFFKFLESLITTDSDNRIRKVSIDLIGKIYPYKSFELMKWALQYERNYYCIVSIIQIISYLKTKESKKILVDLLKKILSMKFIDRNQSFKTEGFRKSLQEKLNKNELKYWDSDQLVEIIINFKTISHLLRKFYYVFFKWENGMIIELDLSELGWNVSRSWRINYANRLGSLDEIDGLYNLKRLKILNLTNNRIDNVKQLKKLPHLTHLYLTNNKMDDIKNIIYLKELKNLELIDLRGNGIANYIKSDDFKPTRVILKSCLYFL